MDAEKNTVALEAVSKETVDLVSLLQILFCQRFRMFHILVL